MGSRARRMAPVRKTSVKATKKPAAPKATKRDTPKTPSPSERPSSLRGVRCVVINLEKRPDRWAKVQKSFRKSAPWLPLSRLNAVDGKASPPSSKDVTATWSTERLSELFHWYKSTTIKMSPGERGCCGSHIEAWKLAAAGSKPLLVVEDDAVVLPCFTKTLDTALREAPKGTGAIFLSAKDRGYPKRVGKVLMDPYYVWTTVGYLIWPAAARKFLALRPLDMPVDNFMAWHIKAGHVKTFSVKPAALRQANTWNVGSDVPHSDDVAHK